MLNGNAFFSKIFLLERSIIIVISVNYWASNNLVFSIWACSLSQTLTSGLFLKKSKLIYFFHYLITLANKVRACVFACIVVYLLQKVFKDIIDFLMNKLAFCLIQNNFLLLFVLLCHQIGISFNFRFRLKRLWPEVGSEEKSFHFNL